VDPSHDVVDALLALLPPQAMFPLLHGEGDNVLPLRNQAHCEKERADEAKGHPDVGCSDDACFHWDHPFRVD